MDVQEEDRWNLGLTILQMLLREVRFAFSFLLKPQAVHENAFYR